MTGLAIASLVTAAVGAHVATYANYRQGKEAQRQANAQAELAARQAEAQQAQAAEYERQAKIESQKAGIEQLQGEQEAERIMRQRAQDIGSAYANAAGNGILVSGSETDTFANILKSQIQESQADIDTIRANTAMNVWSREESSRSLLFSAEQSRRAASDSLFTAEEYRRQGKSAKKAGTLSAIGSYISGGAYTGQSAYTTFGRR